MPWQGENEETLQFSSQAATCLKGYECFYLQMPNVCDFRHYHARFGTFLATISLVIKIKSLTLYLPSYFYTLFVPGQGGQICITI